MVMGNFSLVFSVQCVSATRGHEPPVRLRHVRVVYVMTASSCSVVGKGMTAASEKSMSRFMPGISATAICVSTLPLTSIPCSLLSTARSRLSVFSEPFISTSARASRTSSTALRAASSSSEALMILICCGWRAASCSAMACLPSTAVRMKSAKPSQTLRSITSSVCASAGDATATMTRLPNERSL